MRPTAAIIIFMLAAWACPLSQAEDLSAVTDEFYSGLAAIIEANMDSPDNCVSEVDNYYKKNQKSVEKIREFTAKTIEQAMAVKDRYGAVTDEEPEDVDLMAVQEGITAPGLTSGSARYANALKNFAMKYPREGLKIAGKSTQLLPGADSGR